LPPVVDHRYLEPVLGPQQGVRIAALPRQKEGPELGKVVLLHVLPDRILSLDRSKRGRGGEQRSYLMLRGDAPETAWVGPADPLSLVEGGGAAGQERGVVDVRMADHPADVGSCPKDFPRPPSVDS